MLSIAKIGSAASQSAGSGGYLRYLSDGPKPKASAYLEYAAGPRDIYAPAPFWACKGPSLLGLGALAEEEHVERLARGLHPLTGEPLVKGAGERHVMGLDMTFSAPKDFSAVFAGSDSSTRSALVECLQDSARAALAYAESAATTRHGHGGIGRRIAEAAAAYCVVHLASRALDPALHCHAMLLNVGKRAGSADWSALEHRPQFDRKMATGALFRAELAHRLRGMGFRVAPAGPYFTLEGIDDRQRMALSTRSREIDARLREAGLEGAGAEARQAAALATRGSKAEPPLPELLARFEAQAEALGITPESVAAMRAAPLADEPFAIDRGALLDELTASQSCAASHEALALICEKAMGRWPAARCLEELSALMADERVVQLGRTEGMSEVFTTRARLELEAAASARVADGKASAAHRVDRALVDRAFDLMERDIGARLGVAVSLSQQRAAAIHAACETGDHAFVEGWAGAGKTTMLKAAGSAMRQSGLDVSGCCQSAAAAQNLARETDIPSRTIASLLLALRDGRSKLGPTSVVVLDEAGMVGSREFSALQQAVAGAGAKLICVGDPKQLQPIEAGGICASLARIHGKAEISDIKRQRTDCAPLMDWLESRGAGRGGVSAETAQALRELPEDARLAAVESLGAADPKLARAFARWRARFDFEWMREAVEAFATGRASDALALMDGRGRLRIAESHAGAIDGLIAGWAADKTPLARKAIVAATRSEVAELNVRARDILIERGAIDDTAGIDVEIKRRDDTTDTRRLAPGDRIVFTMNERQIGVANGACGTVKAVEPRLFDALLVVELDDANERGEDIVRVPASFGRFDWALCLTNHKSQGRTYDSAHVLANPSMSDREWTYVAASRSRFATTIHADASALGLVDAESHRADGLAPKSREAAIEKLASRMSRSRAKGTTLDYSPAGANGSKSADENFPAPAPEASDQAGGLRVGPRMVAAARRALGLMSARAARRAEREAGLSR